ncbi:S8 family serine peptidase [Maribacter sp.]|nr:S8 family serine peptidase [Maribacter sp.]
MKPTYIFALLLCIMVAMSSVAQDRQRLILQLEKGVEIKSILKNIASNKSIKSEWQTVKCLSKNLNIWLLEVVTVNSYVDRNSDARTQFLKDIGREKGIESVQYDRPVALRAIPNDPLFAKQWQYQNKGLGLALNDADIDAPEAWEITTGGKTEAGDEIVVAIIDGGIDLQHPDLGSNIWQNQNEIPYNQVDDDANGYVDDRYGWNFKMNNASIDNDGLGHWHGTAVAGIVGALGNNGIGVSGVNWDIKMMNLVANSTIVDIISAYDYILEMRRRYNDTDGKEGAFIVATNTSLGISRGRQEEAPIWCAMFDALGEVGILNVAATANENINVDLEGDLPTSCTSDYLISVTSTNAFDTKDVLTAYGMENVDLGAPGVKTFTTANGSNYDFFGGTSAATPHVAGAIGLLYSSKVFDFIEEVKKDPAASALQIKNFILNSTDALGSLRGKCLTGGRLNLHSSLSALYAHYATEPQFRDPELGVVLNAIYPNPAQNSFNIDFTLTTETKDVQLQLFDVHGRRIKTQELGSLHIGEHRIEVPLNATAKGMYFVKINQSGALTLLVY